MNEKNTAPEMAGTGVRKHVGSCHCGAIRFEVEADLSKGGSRCNCSVCVKTAQFGVMVKPDAFKLLTPEESLGSYEWGRKVSRRYFCKTCGVYCFGKGHLEVLGGDFVSFSLNCLDGVELGELPVIYWDGRHDNWQAGPRPLPWPILRGQDREKLSMG